jgi:hypothetical protein
MGAMSSRIGGQHDHGSTLGRQAGLEGLRRQGKISFHSTDADPQVCESVTAAVKVIPQGGSITLHLF